MPLQLQALKVEVLYLRVYSKRSVSAFFLARKPGKLPNEIFVKDFDLEYGSTSIEIQKNTMVNESDRVVIVDDLVATGGQPLLC
ncbi:MAG: hypothetical protein Ct9H90mP13_07020 [Pseudomonadota bacterium]|nr:MAG: hypothetical protein Ct9H90mP13_07020 [Pseudomonadota bacterium]